MRSQPPVLDALERLAGLGAGRELFTGVLAELLALVGAVMCMGFALYVLYATTAALILNPCVFL